VRPDFLREGARKRGEEGLRAGVCREHWRRHGTRKRTDVED
jgi:hypothetical protein